MCNVPVFPVNISGCALDLLKEINEKIKSHAEWTGAKGLRAILVHIENAERYHRRANAERDEHLYTDVIYRTNHAFEGILKEAYGVLAGGSADRRTPNEIETYLVDNNVLPDRVVDLLKNYRQHWRNPSTHDYQLFFSEHESYLAIVTVSAFVSILVDQMLKKIAYLDEIKRLESAAGSARKDIENFGSLKSIEKVWKVLVAFGQHYILDFENMSKIDRNSANAQMAAFITKFAPELTVIQDATIRRGTASVTFDLMIEDGDAVVAIETRDPRPYHFDGGDIISDVAIDQLAERLHLSGLNSGIVFFYPKSGVDEMVAITASTAWPKDLAMCEIHGGHQSECEYGDDVVEWHGNGIPAE